MTMTKLIRDKLKGLPGSELRRVRDKDEHTAYLIAKLHEEVSEVAGDLTNPEEYADVLEALMTLANLNNIEWSEVMMHVITKHRTRGGFAGGTLMVVA